MVYCTHFHSISKHGLILCGNLSRDTELLKIQKFTIKIATGHRSKELLRDLIKIKNFCHFQSQYLLSLVLFVVNKESDFKLIYDALHLKAGQKYKLHQTSSDLSLYEKQVC
jgi:hypothetical protein